MTRKYPGDAVFEAGTEFSDRAAEYAAQQRLERARMTRPRPSLKPIVLVDLALLVAAVTVISAIIVQ